MNGEASLSLAWLRCLLAAVAFVVIVEAALGFAGATAAAAPSVTLVAMIAGGLALRRGWRALREGRPGTTTAPLAPADALAALALVVALATRLGEGLNHANGAFTYDVLSYHLHLPASWLVAGRVGIVPTPFGDQAPAYAPANAELTYLLALAATGNFRLAHAGQAGYAALAALAVVATARQLGLSRRLAVGAALAFLMIPEVWQQATGAMTDLALASFLLACLPFLVRLRASVHRSDVLALGAGLGLAVGTKYAGAVLALPLLLITAVLLVRGRGAPGWPRRRAAVALTALLFACGGFWYVRNTILTGDPTFPVTLQLGPVVLGRGLYGRPEMRRWQYHLACGDLQPLLEMFIETGAGFLACLVGGLTALLLRRRFVGAVLLGAYVALGWLVIPYQQSRFFFVAWGLGALVTAAAAQLAGWPAVRELAFAPALVGAAWQYPTPARLLTAALWTLAAALGTRASIVPDPTPASHRFVAGARWLLPPAAGLLVLGLVGWTRLPDHSAPQAARIGDGHDAGWDFASARLHGRRIAYTGSNLPLPLWGWHLQNRVQYVNVAGKPTDLLHDFRGDVRLGAPALDTAEPAPERAHPDRAAWLANLTAARTDTLFVARLYPDVAASMPHDGDGFPTERHWADALPDCFHLTFATADVRIYDVRAQATQECARPTGARQVPAAP